MAENNTFVSSSSSTWTTTVPTGTWSSSSSSQSSRTGSDGTTSWSATSSVGWNSTSASWTSSDTFSPPVSSAQPTITDAPETTLLGNTTSMGNTTTPWSSTTTDAETTSLNHTSSTTSTTTTADQNVTMSSSSLLPSSILTTLPTAQPTTRVAKSQQASSPKSYNRTGLIAGLTVSLSVVAILIGVALWMRRRRRRGARAALSSASGKNDWDPRGDKTPLPTSRAATPRAPAVPRMTYQPTMAPAKAPAASSFAPAPAAAQPERMPAQMLLAPSQLHVPAHRLSNSYIASPSDPSVLSMAPSGATVRREGSSHSIRPAPDALRIHGPAAMEAGAADHAAAMVRPEGTARLGFEAEWLAWQQAQFHVLSSMVPTPDGAVPPSPSPSQIPFYQRLSGQGDVLMARHGTMNSLYSNAPYGGSTVGNSTPTAGGFDVAEAYAVMAGRNSVAARGSAADARRSARLSTAAPMSLSGMFDSERGKRDSRCSSQAPTDFSASPRFGDAPEHAAASEHPMLTEGAVIETPGVTLEPATPSVTRPSPVEAAAAAGSTSPTGSITRTPTHWTAEDRLGGAPMATASSTKPSDRSLDRKSQDAPYAFMSLSTSRKPLIMPAASYAADTPSSTTDLGPSKPMTRAIAGAVPSVVAAARAKIEAASTPMTAVPKPRKNRESIVHDIVVRTATPSTPTRPTLAETSAQVESPLKPLQPLQYGLAQYPLPDESDSATPSAPHVTFSPHVSYDKYDPVDFSPDAGFMPAVPSGLRHGALPSRHRHNGTASSHTSSASTSSQGLASPAMSMRSLTSGTTAPPSPATTIERVPEHRTSMPSSPSLRSAGSGTGRRKSVTIAKMEGDSDSDDSVDHVPLAKITPVNRRQSLMPSAQAGMV